MFSPDQRFGLSGEEFVAGRFRAAGFSVSVPSNFCSRFDLVVDGVLPVSVKTSRWVPRRVSRLAGGAWRWSGRYAFDVGYVSPSVECCVVLVCVCDDGVMVPFYCPGDVFVRRCYASITSHPLRYRGLYSAWREEFQAVYTSLSFLARSGGQMQLPLWGFDGSN